MLMEARAVVLQINPNIQAASDNVALENYQKYKRVNS
jgi:hypothetical protein